MPHAASDLPDKSPMTLLRECEQRQLEREGVPMVLALVDERGKTVPSQNDLTLAEGRAYAELLDRYRRALVPSTAFRSGDEGALITALVVLAYAHFLSTEGESV